MNSLAGRPSDPFRQIQQCLVYLYSGEWLHTFLCTCCFFVRLDSFVLLLYSYFVILSVLASVHKHIYSAD